MTKKLKVPDLKNISDDVPYEQPHILKAINFKLDRPFVRGNHHTHI